MFSIPFKGSFNEQYIMKTIVLYYSKNGSNRYLAHEIAKGLSCDMEEIKPL